MGRLEGKETVTIGANSIQSEPFPVALSAPCSLQWILHMVCGHLLVWTVKLG
jgi:hypothetical protein